SASSAAGPRRGPVWPTYQVYSRTRPGENAAPILALGPWQPPSAQCDRPLSESLTSVDLRHAWGSLPSAQGAGSNSPTPGDSRSYRGYSYDSPGSRRAIPQPRPPRPGSP